MSINFAIYAVTVCSIAYFAVMFVAGLGRRLRRVEVARVEAVEECEFSLAVPGGEFCNVASSDAAEAARVEAFLNRPVAVDNVVPFHRPRRPVLVMPTDRELIELAKSCDWPGSRKWSYSRKLSQQVRAKLLAALPVEDLTA